MTLGVRERTGSVYYLHSGVPIYSHEANDLTKFRYVTSNLSIAKGEGISEGSIRYWVSLGRLKKNQD